MFPHWQTVSKMPSTRSEKSEGTLFSSATYINNDDGTKSVPSKKMLPVINTDKLGMKIRVIKGLIDLRFMIRRWFFNLCFFIGLLFFVTLCVMLILFYFLYTNQPICDVGIIDSKDSTEKVTYIVPNSPDESQEDEQPTKEAKKHNWFFWTTQIYGKIDEANKEITSNVANMLGAISRNLERKISEIVIEQEEKTRGFWMELTNTERFRFETMKARSRGGRTTTSKKKPGLNPRPTYPTYPRYPNDRPPVRPTSVWIGPPGRPGEQLSGLHVYIPTHKVWDNLFEITEYNNKNASDPNKEEHKGLSVRPVGYNANERRYKCKNKRLFSIVGLDKFCPLI